MLGPPGFARCCPFVLGGERVPRVPRRGRGELSQEALLLTGGILESPQPTPRPNPAHTPRLLCPLLSPPLGVDTPLRPPSSPHPRKLLWWRGWQGGLAETPPTPLPQATPTWSMPSSGSAVSSTSWPTCPPTRRPSIRHCSGAAGRPNPCPARARRMAPPWRGPTPPRPLSQAPSRPAWWPLQVRC